MKGSVRQFLRACRWKEWTVYAIATVASALYFWSLTVFFVGVVLTIFVATVETLLTRFGDVPLFGKSGR